VSEGSGHSRGGSDVETNGRVKKRNRNNVTGNPRSQDYHLCINQFYNTIFILIGKRTNAIPSNDDGASDSCSDAEAYGNNGLSHAPSNSHVQSFACVEVDIYDANNADYWMNMGGSEDMRVHRPMGPVIEIGQTIRKQFYDEARGEFRTYTGTVSAYNGTHYQIVYSDDDKEQMSSNEVQLYNC